MDYDKRKNEILTNYFNSGTLTAKVEGYLIKFWITRKTQLVNDILLQVYFELCKYNSQKLVEMYDANPSSIEAVAVTICKRQFRYRNNDYSNPSHSYGTKLLFGSTYKQLEYLSPTDEFNNDNEYKSNVLFDGDIYSELSYESSMWEKVQLRLTSEEKVFIEELLAGVKPYKTRPFKEYRIFKEYIFNKIKNMNLTENQTPMEQIKNQLSMNDNNQFDIMFNEELTLKEKREALNYSENKYIAQKRMLLKKIKSLNIK